TDLRPIPYESIPPSLTVLELNRCEIPAAWFCGSAVRALPQLQHLVVHNVPAFSDRHLLTILEGLEHLVLRHCVIGDAAVGFIGRHMKHLQFLEVSGAYSLTNTGLACLATLQRLETLCLDLCNKISPGDIIALCRALPQLRNLKLDRAHFEDEVISKIQ
ncbi:PREDICTED: F-box/LRR-repeat protein 12, partial [Phaethon lepturus]|uniref:F-box/LRR-repeat protein 12 n=1 Tax=Phaethon lepturus TaxID=97097 RepID=UPI000530773B